MKNKNLIRLTERFVKQVLKRAESGHDYDHIERVLQNAKKILKKEKANNSIVILGVLLHDIADPKFHDGDEKKAENIAKAFLLEAGTDEETISQVLEIIDGISYKGGHNQKDKMSIELQIAQDADRLDALGAIGIARAFSYGGFKGRRIYNKKVEPIEFKDVESYRNSDSPTINHFYEKLLKLKGLMNTKTGKKIADKRHDFMKVFLKRFLKEMKGKS